MRSVSGQRRGRRRYLKKIKDNRFPFDTERRNRPARKETLKPWEIKYPRPYLYRPTAIEIATTSLYS